MDFSSIFNGESLTLEQFNERTASMKLADLSTGEYVAKGKYDADVKKARDDLKNARETISTLEANKGDMETLQAELKKYQDAEEARTKAEQEAQARAATLERFKAAKGDKEFSSEYAESGVLEAFSKALADPANTGKGDAELFTALTQDAVGLFKNPQQEQVVIRGVNHQGGTIYTADQIRKMTPDEINKNWADVSASLKGMK